VLALMKENYSHRVIIFVHDYDLDEGETIDWIEAEFKNTTYHSQDRD
jgi:hypothetical protein